MNKNLLTLLTVVIVLLGGFLLLGRQKPTTAPITTTVATEEPTIAPTATSTEVTGKANPVKEFTVGAQNFSYSVKEIKVKKGDTVKITLNVKEGLHDWVVDEFNARTKQTPEGKKDTVEFIANKAGTFEYYCSVDQHRQKGMVGKLIIE